VPHRRLYHKYRPIFAVLQLTSMVAPTKTPPATLRDALRAWWHDWSALIVGTVIWLAIAIMYWPKALSFWDDVGYVGEAKLLLMGRIFPQMHDAGIWIGTAHGLVPQYPLLCSLLLVPLFAIAPRAVFALGVLGAIGICWTAARVLKSWGTSAVWALLLLAHPTIVIISRTATADIPLAAFTLGAWWTLRQDRRGLCLLLFAAMFAVKPAGFVLGSALVAGEWLRILPPLAARHPDAKRRLTTSLLSIAVGFCVVFATNEMSAHQLWFAYDHRFLGTPPFWFSYFRTTAPAHIRTILLFPPLLILGSLPYLRRREFGPLCIIFGFGTLMSCYFFVDAGTSWVESFVLSPRLLLPVVVFLLIGYADLLARAADRLIGNDKKIGPVLIAGTASIALAVSMRHNAWQARMGEARVAAEQITQTLGSRELGLAVQAAKAGLLFPGPTPFVSMTHADVPVVLCSSRSGSYRAGTDTVLSCAIPGYRVEFRTGDFEVLVRASLGRSMKERLK
jgi:hypothetical protein